MAPFPCCTGKILARRRSAAPKQGSPYRPRGAKQGWPRKKSAPPKNYYLGDLYTVVVSHLGRSRSAPQSSMDTARRSWAAEAGYVHQELDRNVPRPRTARRSRGAGQCWLRTFAVACTVWPAWLPTVAADQVLSDPCASPCGRAHTCGGLNVSFTCDAISLLGCDCTGCCLALLSPLAPPAPSAPPPLLPPPPSSPRPLFPPLTPDGLSAGSTTELHAVVDELNRNHPAEPPYARTAAVRSRRASHAASVGTPHAAEPAPPRSAVATQPTIPAPSPARATRAAPPASPALAAAIADTTDAAAVAATVAAATPTRPPSAPPSPPPPSPPPRPPPSWPPPSPPPRPPPSPPPPSPPPSSPPSPPPPSPPPFPPDTAPLPPPPRLPSTLAAATLAAAAVAPASRPHECVRGSRVVTLSGRYPLGGSPLVVRGVDLTLEGVGAEGATLDAEGVSRAIEVTDGASLTLRTNPRRQRQHTRRVGAACSCTAPAARSSWSRSSVRDSVINSHLAGRRP